MVLGWPAPDLPAEVKDSLVGAGAPFEVVVDEVLGAPTQVFARRPRSVVELLRSAGEQFGDRPYVVFPGRTVTYGEMLGMAGAVAARLRDEFGVRRGDRVAIASANRLEYVVAFWATSALGALTVGCNGWWTGPELAYGLGLTRPVVLLGDGRRLERLAREDRGALPVVSFDEEPWTAGSGLGCALPDVETDEDDPFAILFTSGTTGRPKGALITHRNNIHFGLATQLRAAEVRARAQLAGRELPAPTGPPCSLGASPMFHVSGLTASVVLSAMIGQTVVYPPPGRWCEDVHLQLTQDHKVTRWSLVPTQLWRLLEWPDLTSYDLSSLRSIGGGSAVWPPELLRRLEERLPWVRPGLGLGYGMTETVGLGTSLGGAATYVHADSIGEPSPTVEVEIREPGTRRPLGPGEVGEIALRSGAVFAGYFDDPQATAAALDAQRWYHTGDVGVIRDGLVFLAGRRSDLIIRGGENIYPVEIENCLIEDARVAEVAVVGVPHPILGQQVKAYVVPRPGSFLSPEDVRDACRGVLAVFKVPEHVEIVDSLPHNATGKVIKHLLGAPSASSGFVEE